MAGTIPTAIENLSTTAASNDPTEGSGAAMTLVNDGLRAAYAFVRQTVSAGSDIASASTITPPSTGSSFNLTGTTTVTAIGSTNSWDGRIVWFRHTGAHSFTNSATLVCLGGASITFASGDISAWRQRTSGTWDQVVYSKGGALPLFNTGNNWSIDASGRLLNGGNTQPSFRASLSANQTSGNTIIFDSVSHNVGSNYNSTNGTFTAPVAGRYLFTWKVAILNTSGVTTNTYIRLMVNGSAACRVGPDGVSGIPNNASADLSSSVVVSLNASDTILIDSQTTLTATFLADGGSAGETYFSGHYLG